MFRNGGELYWPHETLKASYTHEGLRRIIVIDLDIIDWVAELQREEELFEFAAQDDTIRITHSRLCRIGWQLRLASPTVYILVLTLNL